MSTKKEKREFPRVQKLARHEYQRVIVKVEVSLRTKKKYQVSGWTRDLSVKGVYVICEEVLPVGAKVKCRICLGDIRKGAPVIDTDGKIIRCDVHGLAIQFRDVAVESFKKLRDFFSASESN